jgi:hypothetical protein
MSTNKNLPSAVRLLATALYSELCQDNDSDTYSDVTICTLRFQFDFPVKSLFDFFQYSRLKPCSDNRTTSI